MLYNEKQEFGNTGASKNSIWTISLVECLQRSLSISGLHPKKQPVVWDSR